MSPVNSCGYKVLEQDNKQAVFDQRSKLPQWVRLCLFISFFLFVCCSVAAQISHIQIENITFPNGQQLADVRAITQDSTGLLWFYTYSPSALYTYDGKTLTKFPAKGPGYQLPESFFFYTRPQDSVFYLTPPTKDSIWLFDPYRRAPSAYLTGAKHMFRIAVNSKGQKWVQTYVNEGLAIGRIVSGHQVDPIDTVQYRWYYDVVGIWQDHYYVKISDRVYVFDEDKLRHTYEFYPKGPNSASSTCVVDAEDTMWAVYSPEGLRKDLTLFYLRPGMQGFEPFPGQEAMTGSGKFGMIFFDGQDLWYRSDAPFRLFRKKAGSEHFEDMTAMILRRDDLYPFYNSTIKTIFRDRSGEVWIASQAGVVKVSLEEKVFRKYVIDVTVDAACRDGTCAVRGIGEDGRGNIYFSYEDGLAVLDAASGRLSALPLDISISPMLPHQLGYYQDKLYLNEYEIDLTTGAFHSIFPETFNANMARHIDGPNHRMWMAVHRAPAHFYRYDLETGSLTKASFPDSVIHHQNDRIRRLHYSPTTRSLFMGTVQRGLIELKESGEAKAVSICCNATNDLYEDDQQQLWIAGGPEGLSKLDLQTRRITAVPYRIAPDVGPLKNVFHLLPEGREHLWLIGDQGVFRLHTPGGELSRFPMFPSLSKMGFFELPAFAASDGTCYVGAIDGSVYAFRPEEVMQRACLEEKFPIALTRYSRYDARLDSSFVQQDDLAQLQEIRLTHRHRSFSLEFFVPDFRNSAQNRYTYYLEGYDRNWSTPTNFNQLQYENLPPGEYTLRIRGGLMDEYFSGSERVLRVTVLQAWYKTGWAIAAYVLVLTACVLLLYRFQLRRRLEKAEAARIRELDTLKTSFYTNITHEFRTPLTVMLGATDQIGGYEQEKSIIRRNGKNLLRLINQLLDLSKMDSGNMKLDLVKGEIIAYLLKVGFSDPNYFSRVFRQEFGVAPSEVNS